jgi:hypothetical protein
MPRLSRASLSGPSCIVTLGDLDLICELLLIVLGGLGINGLTCAICMYSCSLFPFWALCADPVPPVSLP